MPSTVLRVFQAYVHSNFTSALQSRWLKPPFSRRGNSEAQRVYRTCSGSQSQEEAELGFEPRVWHCTLNSWAPPPFRQVLGALRALQGQWPHCPARGSLEGNIVPDMASTKCPWALEIPVHSSRMEKQHSDSDLGNIYSCPQPLPTQAVQGDG